MHGCMRLGWALVLLLPTGCDPEKAPVDSPPPAAEKLANAFDAKTSATIAGRVTWQGEAPNVPSFQVHAYLDYANVERLRGEQPNPHAPKIDLATQGVGKAVIVLRDVAPERAKLWHHPPVKVQIQRDRLEIVQGEATTTIGFVERGSEIACVSRDADYHTLRARGAAFFTLPFAVPNRPTQRRLDQAGIVELSTGAGFYWRRAYLFVLDHPYGTLTASDGRFVLEQVPAGTYRLTAWLPNWHVERREHDPETGIVSRIVFAPAVELEQTVTVAARQTCETTFPVSQEKFSAKRKDKK